MNNKPARLPANQPDGAALKPLVQVLLDRRATSHFAPEPVPTDYLEAILRLGSQAPSGYNLQPWRFIVVQDQANRERLRRAAYDQEKVGEAPVVIIFVGLKDTPRRDVESILAEGARRGAGKPENVPQMAKQARQFLESMNMDVWVNRHVMIAFTATMLAAETYGFDTAPMEGFDPAKVKQEFGVPEEGDVVALLAIGRLRGPDRPYPGRFGLKALAFRERYGVEWNEAAKSA